MKIKILGSGREVGRSAILVDDEKGEKKILMDCGVKIQPEPPKYPLLEKVDAAIISHAHLDHSGGVPLLAQKNKIPIFMTDVTLELSALLIRDSMKIANIQGYDIPFSKKDMRNAIKNTKMMNYNERFNAGNFSCSFFDAGHIPGSASVLIENKGNGKKTFYTADIQTTESHLMKPCRLPGKVDVLVIESTYSYKDHPKREQEERKFLDMINETLARNETALVPVFAVGRSQEILFILENYTKKVAFDGMGKIASEIVADYGARIKDAKRLRSILKKIKFIKTASDRREALKKYPIIVSTAGMLSGGPAVHYLKELKNRAGSKVLFTGFLVEGTPGRNLMKTKAFENEEEYFKVQCGLHQFDMSAHTDRSGLFSIIKKTKPEKVICVHGDKTQQFAKDIEEKFGIQAFAPRNGETIRV